MIFIIISSPVFIFRHTLCLPLLRAYGYSNTWLLLSVSAVVIYLDLKVTQASNREINLCIYGCIIIMIIVIICLGIFLMFAFNISIHLSLIVFIIQCVKAHAILCPHQLLTRSDNIVLVAQGGTATPGATKQFLPLDRVFKIYIYIYARLTKRRNYIVHSSSFLVQFVIFKNAFTFGCWCHYALAYVILFLGSTRVSLIVVVIVPTEFTWAGLTVIDRKWNQKTVCHVFKAV